MTTIAYKDGVIAYDSRSSAGQTIIDDDFEKKTTVNGANYFYAGSLGDKETLIKLDQGADSQIPDSAGAIKHRKGELSYIGMNKKDGFWRVPINKDKPYAIGSGEDHAWTAMDMGATAKQAVEMAKKRDSGTGGKVRTYKVK